jgi:hypothetical protein
VPPDLSCAPRTPSLPRSSLTCVQAPVCQASTPANFHRNLKDRHRTNAVSFPRVAPPLTRPHVPTAILCYTNNPYVSSHIRYGHIPLACVACRGLIATCVASAAARLFSYRRMGRAPSCVPGGYRMDVTLDVGCIMPSGPWTCCCHGYDRTTNRMQTVIQLIPLEESFLALAQ